MKKYIEGSMAVAEAVVLCKPNVISAYPITPQTHIVEDLSQMYANAEFKGQFVNVESEFSAASVCLGAVVTGARAYTATTSQGLLLMSEVLFNMAGMRLPLVLTCANRAISAPINIWTDHSDAMALRDSGFIQLYAENNQEAADLHYQAYKISEDDSVRLPVMVNMDGFLLTHSFEPVDMPTQQEVDDFLPSYKPRHYLDVKHPITFGSMVGEDGYMEVRYNLEEAMKNAFGVIEKVTKEFEQKFGRKFGIFIDTYKMEDAETVIVALGSVVGTIKESIDLMRANGIKVGLMKVRTFRPFPKQAIVDCLKNIKNVIVIDRASSVGSGGILATEIRSAFYGNTSVPKVNSYIVGLGGRDITIKTITDIVGNFANVKVQDSQFVELDHKYMQAGDEYLKTI
ncbi:MAG: pyruvate ferredoxin oxidoreductase [Candidatus Wallbacteria bacterium GWC2_49_35]|uniref:Pyruvate ferredoxin oxidoreductase n=1 Tax=Candidatus Wallbacteria bacterium GWC2_49_35 TaxID=1817813 RepID=A0A1F7WLE7_9BACT|nr:MAG: pyruvate ferredoxin oxidoreductase [Candidatus Wallbacteria bacterium GWC2_49_35]